MAEPSLAVRRPRMEYVPGGKASPLRARPSHDQRTMTESPAAISQNRRSSVDPRSEAAASPVGPTTSTQNVPELEPLRRTDRADRFTARSRMVTLSGGAKAARLTVAEKSRRPTAVTSRQAARRSRPTARATRRGGGMASPWSRGHSKDLAKCKSVTAPSRLTLEPDRSRSPSCGMERRRLVAARPPLPDR